jgi:hypothetical protein
MLSCEGHGRLTQAALAVLRWLPVRKPYWQYLPALNAVRRWLRWPVPKPATLAEPLPSLAAP